MREEVLNWWKQAQSDIDSAQAVFDIGRFYVAAFLSQQAVEKGLKALHIYKTRENIVTHNLISLAKKVGFPEDKLSLLKEINADYVVTRYVDAANGLPSEIYDESITKEHLNAAKEAMQWIKKQLEN